MMENTIPNLLPILTPSILLYRLMASALLITNMDMDTTEDSQALIPRRLNMNEGELNSTKVYDVPLLPYWLGFATLNALGKVVKPLKNQSLS